MRAHPPIWHRPVLSRVVLALVFLIGPMCGALLVCLAYNVGGLRPSVVVRDIEPLDSPHEARAGYLCNPMWDATEHPATVLVRKEATP